MQLEVEKSLRQQIYRIYWSFLVHDRFLQHFSSDGCFIHVVPKTPLEVVSSFENLSHAYQGKTLLRHALTKKEVNQARPYQG